ncbi:hypothetical protein MCC01953_02820 [Bifidobacteriaceae bacterium MCC01953]|nr:hypothetical protein MCC01953_02820 [Bifidobacteriaceae bacterium MCC01953]
MWITDHCAAPQQTAHSIVHNLGAAVGIIHLSTVFAYPVAPERKLCVWSGT